MLPSATINEEKVEEEGGGSGDGTTTMMTDPSDSSIDDVVVIEEGTEDDKQEATISSTSTRSITMKTQTTTKTMEEEEEEDIENASTTFQQQSNVDLEDEEGKDGIDSRIKRPRRSNTALMMESVRRFSSMIFQTNENGPEHDWFICNRNRNRNRNRSNRWFCNNRRRRSPQQGNNNNNEGNEGEQVVDSDSSLDLEGYQELLTSPSVISHSIGALRFAVFADTLNGMVLYPNYALMALPDAHEDSFTSTSPFEFSGATYFIPMTGLLGMAIAGVFSGKLSDLIGRKPVILFCLGGSVFGSALKWFLRHSFWAFCSANFINGLLSGSLPVALAFMSDLFASPKKKSKEFSMLVALYVIGQSTGGVLGILLQNHGLFAPLWGGVVIMFLALCINIKFLVEPGRLQVPAEIGDVDDDEEDIANLPTKIDTPTMVHILFGAFVDIAGSKALFPICMSPLAFETFYLNFVNEGEEPLMSVNAYKWLTVLVCILVVPSSVMAPKFFQKFGLASSCVFGNFITGVVIIALLQIGNIDPPTQATYAGFITVLYVGFPFTVFSQLSISPMLDKLAPIDKRGYVQGSFTTILNCGNAIAPWLLGMATDALGTTNGLWIGIGLSFAATIINIPLTYKKEFQPSKVVVKKESLSLTPEQEEEYIQMALRGEYVPARVIQVIQMSRIERGEKFIINRCVTYDRDRERGLGQLCSEAKKDLKTLRHNFRHVLSKVNNKDPTIPNAVQCLNHGFPDEMEDLHKEIGQWFGDYLKDNGYIGLTPVQNLKMMIIRSFPTINNGDELTTQTFEESLLNLNRLYNRHLEDENQMERADVFRNVFKRPPRRMAPVG